MDSFQIILSIIFILSVFIFYMRVAIKSFSEVESIDDFIIYNKKLRETGVFAATYSAEMSLATVFIAFLTLAPVFGVSLFWSVFTFIAGQVVLFLFIPRIKSQVDEGDTLQSFLGKYYESQFLRKIASVTSIIGFVGLFSTEIIVGSQIFESLFGSVGIQIGFMIFVSFLVVFYTCLGGFKSVIVTDKIQSLGVLVAVIILFASAIYLTSDKTDLIEPKLLSSVFLTPLMLTNFILINIAYPLVDMSAWQRIAAATNSKVARRGFGISILLFLISWSLVLLSGLILAPFTAGSPAGGIVTTLGNFGADNVFLAVLAGLGLAGLSAAMLSTGDTFLISASQAYTMDIAKSDFFDKRKISYRRAEEYKSTDDDLWKEKSILSYARKSVFYLAVSGIFVGIPLQYLGFSVADYVFVFYGSTVALFPAVISALFNLKVRTPFGRMAAISSVSAGILFGWLYGILSVSTNANNHNSLVYKLIDVFPGTPSAYNAPTVAFISATVVFTVISLFGIRRRLAS